MIHDRFSKRAAAQRWAGPALAVMVSAVLAGCGGGSMFGTSSGASSGPSLSDRFGQVFGSKSQAVGEAAPAAEADEPTCPGVGIRFGASTLPVGLPGKPATGTDLRYQATILRTARDCVLSGGEVKARVGIQGRVIVGPAGAPPNVDIPMRIALVQEGISPKVIFTKAYRTSVAIPDGGNVEFNLVAEDIVYPVPKGAEGDSYIFYIGFDPQAVKPEPRAKAKRAR